MEVAKRLSSSRSIRVAQSNGTARSTQKQCVELYGHKGFDTSTMPNPLRFEEGEINSGKLHLII